MTPRWLAWLLRWLPWRRLPPSPSLPVPPESLVRAVEACGYRCLECQSPVVRLDYAPALGWVPVIVHWRRAPDEWCPVLASSVLLELESLDLLDALAAALAPYGGPAYCEPVWHRHELVAA